MYKIKQVPEDFVVRELSTIEAGNTGRYTYFLLKKKGYGTLEAVELLAKKLHIMQKDIGYAGNKDKEAVTEQVCSVIGVSRERLVKVHIKDIEILYLGEGDNPVSLGDLTGNHFVITVRNITELPKIQKRFVNYFGEQRFSTRNVEIGKAIVKKDFRKAVELVVHDKKYARMVSSHLAKFNNDYVGALRRLPKKLLKLYVHSYQSLVWNKAAEIWSKKSKENREVPIVGFATGKDDVVDEILAKEEVRKEDFIIREVPELSAEGTVRELYVEAEGLKVGDLEKDELNSGKRKVELSFTLPKGSYATEFVKQSFG